MSFSKFALCLFVLTSTSCFASTVVIRTEFGELQSLSGSVEPQPLIDFEGKLTLGEPFVMELAYDSNAAPSNVETSRPLFDHFFQAEYEPLYLKIAQGESVFEFPGELRMVFRNAQGGDPGSAETLFDESFTVFSGDTQLYRFWERRRDFIFSPNSDPLWADFDQLPQRLPREDADFYCGLELSKCDFPGGRTSILVSDALVQSQAATLTSVSIVPEPSGSIYMAVFSFVVSMSFLQTRSCIRPVASRAVFGRGPVTGIQHPEYPTGATLQAPIKRQVDSVAGPPAVDRMLHRPSQP